jgi:hypothetical protein
MTKLATTTYVLPLTTVLRRRVLPAPGKVLVRQGQKVAPQDVIAQANFAAEHVLLDAARALQVSPKKVDKYIDRVAGEQVSEGDLLATGPRGIVRRTLRAPCDGKIVFIRNGQVLLQRSATPYELTAGLAGVVAELIPERGAVIEASGSLIQGVWGNGRSDFGVLQPAFENPAAILMSENLEVSQRGAIIVGGYIQDVGVLQAAADIPVRGLILASMSARLVEQALQMPFPILLTEGFGQIPMNSPAFKLLTTNSNRDVSLNAETFDSIQGFRPEVVIPLPVSGRPSTTPLPRAYAPDQKVRAVRAPYNAQVGVIMSLLPGMVTFSNGIRAEAADVRLESGERVAIPLANLEVLEYK